MESTHVDTLSFNENTGLQDFVRRRRATSTSCRAPRSSSRRRRDTAIRVVYSRALSRPDPQDLAQAVGPINDMQNPPTVSLGNPNLKAEHAHNFDLLLEQYLAPLGLIQAGYFSQGTDRSDHLDADPANLRPLRRVPRSRSLATPAAQPCRASRWPINSTSASCRESSQGLGLSANYSFTTSTGTRAAAQNRPPALLRQAPNTWNISPTYDRRGFMSLATRRQLQRREYLRVSSTRT